MKSDTKNTFLRQFGINIRRARIGNSMSQEDLAFEIESSQSYMGRIEMGKVNTSISHAKAIAKALNVSVNRLFDE